MESLVPSSRSFLHRLWHALHDIKPEIGASFDVYGKAEWLGLDFKAGSRLMWFSPDRIDVYILGVTGGLNMGYKQPGLGIFADFEVKAQAAEVLAFRTSDLSKMTLKPRLALYAPCISFGPHAGVGVETALCGHSYISIDPMDLTTFKVYLTVGAWVGAETPDLKMVLALIPKGALRGEAHCVLRFTVPLKAVA
jgi:hypothetical protein